MLDNPFITYGYESPEYFCDRREETKQLISLLTNGNHVALISPRRMGKTGLIYHCFSQLELSEYYTFIVDIYATKNLQDFVYQLGRSIVTRLKPWGQAALDRFLQIVTSLRTGISFDGHGNASWNMALGDINSPTFTLDEIFEYLKSADKRCVVAIDEFQSIASYPETNVEAMLRTYVQHCRNACFLFSGSQQSMMSEIFSSPSRPFYQSVSFMFLKPVAEEQYKLFADKHFQLRNKAIDKNAMEIVYRKFDGITWYIQKVLNQLFTHTAEYSIATAEDVSKAIQDIIAQNEEAYKDIIFQLTAKQRDIMVAIAQEGKAQQITGASFIKRHKLSTASSVQKAAHSLLDKQLLTHHLGIYEIYDKFLGIWISKQGI